MKTFLLLLLSVIIGNAAYGSEMKKITLSADNTVYLEGGVSARSAGRVIQEVYTLHQDLAKGKPIYLVLNTPGGSVVAGAQLIASLKAIDRKIHTVTIFAASMGFHIVQAMDKRYVTSVGVLMSHLAHGGVQGNLPGSANTRLAFWTGLIKGLDVKVVNRTKGKYTLKAYRELIKAEYWAYGSTTVRDGFADETVSVVCDSSFFSQNSMASCPLLPLGGGSRGEMDLYDIELRSDKK